MTKEKLVHRFRMIGIAEGISFLVLLLIAMPLKYYFKIPEAVKAPCIQPVTFTASGILKKYLSGMAINNKTKKEIPSAMPIILKR